MKLLNGQIIASEIIKKLTIELVQNPNIKPNLAVIMVGQEATSELYLTKKVMQAQAIGIKVEIFRFSETVTTNKIMTKINQLNLTDKVNGILVQLPLPAKINTQKIIWAIAPEKDVDGFQMRNFRPPAPLAVLDLLAHYKIPVLKKKITIVGYGMLVGRPLSVLLQKQGANITICTSATKDFVAKIKQADVVISAVGKANLITGEMVKPGQIIIDAGTASENGTTVGDVNFAEVAPIVEAISPVPGGVGPLTVAELLRNVYLATKNQLNSVSTKPKETSPKFLTDQEPFIKKRSKKWQK